MKMAPLERRTLLSAAISPVVAPWQPVADFQMRAGSNLSHATSSDPPSLAMLYLTTNASGLGLSKSDVASATVPDQETDSDTGVTHIYLRQTFNRLPIINSNLNVNVAHNGRILSLGGSFIPMGSIFRPGTLPKVPAITADRAIAQLTRFAPGASNAITVLSAGALADGTLAYSAPALSLDPIAPTLCYVADGRTLKLSWSLNLRTPDGAHWYELNVDAVSGTYSSGVDWADHTSYNVYPVPTEVPNDIASGTLLNADNRILATASADTARANLNAAN